MAQRTHAIVDGLQDPAMARRLSERWVQAGFKNGIDLAGQSAWLEPTAAEALDEAQADHAARVARSFGIELRERAGVSFKADNDLPTLYRQTEHEFRMRLAQGLVFTLPALVIHYLGPLLAGAGAGTPAGMFYPWLIEGLLVGWACLVATWPILWQAGLAVSRLRMTGDVLTAAILVGSWLPSAVGVLSLIVRDRPLFLVDESMFHVTAYALLLAAAQRWLLHRQRGALAGWMPAMLVGVGRLFFAWLVAGALVMGLRGWEAGLGWLLLMPPLLSLGAINPWNPGWASALPVIGFGLFYLLAPEALGRDLAGVWAEVAAGFGAVMVGVFGLGWRGSRAGRSGL